MKKLFVVISLMLLSNIVFAEGNVCIDQAGKKVFSDLACEKRGLQAAKPDFPVSAKEAPLPVFVVTTPEAPSSEAKAASQSNPAKDAGKTGNKTEKRASPWSSDIPLTGIAWFIISLMPVAAILFLGFNLLLIIRKRLRKDRHVRSSMENVG